MVGGYKAVQGGHSDPECTHVIMTLEEYNELLQEIRDAQSASAQTTTNANNAIKKIKAEADKAISNAKAEMTQEVERLQRKVEVEQAAKIYQMGLNQDFKRIARERANADRGIKPKKERSGYVVLSSRQKKYKYKENRHDMAEVYLWETVIQTPYVVDFTAEQAMTETQELFAKDEQGQWLIGRLGIAGEYVGKYEDMLDDPRCAAWKDYNIIVEKIFNANVKVGYWEIFITHTKPLDNIGTELL